MSTLLVFFYIYSKDQTNDGEKTKTAVPEGLPVQAQAKQYELNARTIDDINQENLETYMVRFGDLSGITWNRATNEFITGNQRSKQINFQQAEIEWHIIHAKPDQVGTVAQGYVYMTDEAGHRSPFNLRLVHWTDPEHVQRACLIANKVGGIWDEKKLFNNFSPDILLRSGFELEELPTPHDQEPTDDELEEANEVPEAPQDPHSQLGDLYELADLETGITHRVHCCSSTDTHQVAKTIGSHQPVLMVTDPPYGVVYDPTWRAEAGINKNEGKMGKVQNDDQASWGEAYQNFPGPVAYVWHAGKHSDTVQDDLEAVGFEIGAQIIWKKDKFALSRGSYHWKHEPCWYGVRKGHTPLWRPEGTESTVWTINRSDDKGHGHGTQKPLLAMARPIRHSSEPNDSVYDPFLGSGTTLIAAQMMGRICLANELEPAYVDIIVQRWVNHMTSTATKYKVFKNGEPCQHFKPAA